MLHVTQKFSLWKHSALCWWASEAWCWTTGWPFCWCCLCQEEARILLQLYRFGSVDTVKLINSVLSWTQPKAFVFTWANASCTWHFCSEDTYLVPNTYTLLTSSYLYKSFALCCNRWDSTKEQKLSEKLWKPGWTLCLLPTWIWGKERGEYNRFCKNCKVYRSV